MCAHKSGIKMSVRERTWFSYVGEGTCIGRVHGWLGLFSKKTVRKLSILALGKYTNSVCIEWEGLSDRRCSVSASGKKAGDG